MFGSITAECFLGNLDANSTSIVIEHGKGCDGLRLCQGNISSSRLTAVNGFFMQVVGLVDLFARICASSLKIQLSYICLIFEQVSDVERMAVFHSIL